MAEWKIVLRPEGKNPGEQEERNEGGMVIELMDGDGYRRQEVSRVAFARRNSRNPDVGFEEQLRAEWAKANEAVGLLNEQLRGEAGALQ